MTTPRIPQQPPDPHEAEKAQHRAENERWLREWSSRAILSLDELEREGEPVAPAEEDEERAA